MWLRGLPPPEEPQEMLSSFPSSMYLWLAKKNQTLKMKRPLPQFPSILAIYCFCLLQIPSSGFPRPVADSPDGLDIVQLEDKQDMYKRFLFHYSRTQEPTYQVKTGFLPVYPLTHLAAKLISGRMKRFLQPDAGAAAVGFTRKVCEPCGEHNLPKKGLGEKIGKCLELGHLVASLDHFQKELVSQSSLRLSI
uniref:Neuromedin S n=1 Tax=Rousettus aegyptiacus TaxID=9407 RepID=A0A7J8FKP6_ROUAE|nr:neuromedin S [Rousettus aegyptiacus]